MTKSLRLALITTGQLRHYPVIRLSSVIDRLGPVKAQSVRQASRFANTLRAGYPVPAFEDMAHSRLLLICAPGARLPQIVSGIAESTLGLVRKVVLATGGPFHSEHLDPLRARGADVGSLHPIAGPHLHRYFVEGDRLAVRAAKNLVESAGGHMVEIRKASSPVCDAGVSCVSWLLVALIDASASCLRRSGLSAGRAGPIIDWTAHRTLRAYAKAGRRAFRSPTTSEEREAFRQALSSLRHEDPPLAAYLLDSARLALRRMGRESGWLEPCAAKSSPSI